MYILLQLFLMHLIIYTMLLFWQSSGLFNFQCAFSVLISFTFCTNGHDAHCFLHLFIPGIFFLFRVTLLGNFALIRKSLRFVCLLKAIIRGSGNVCLRCSSWVVIVLQCLSFMACRFGSRGYQETTHSGISEAEMMKTFRTAGFYVQKLSGRGKSA